jgi:hypothetical protein
VSAPIRLAGEAPLDHVELLSRLRFSLDDPAKARDAHAERVSKAFDNERMDARGKSMRVSARLMPTLHRVVREACERLMLSEEPETYIEQGSDPNAFAISDGKRSFIKLNSAIVNLLEPEELCAVVGHELAHAGYKHSSREGADESNSMGLLLDLERSRAQEVSADRVGLLAVADPIFALRAELKMACGLGARYLTPDIDAFLEQLSAEDPDVDAKWDDTSTHPSFKFRFWAQRHFLESDLYRSLKALKGGRPFAEVEAEIEDRFLGIGSGMAFRATADALHESLAWLGMLAVAADGQVTDVERAALVELVGRIWADDAYAYARRHGLKAVERRARETLAPLKHGGLRARQRLEHALAELIERAGAADRAAALQAIVEESLRH